VNERYKWVALSNTTLAVLLATLDVSITLIAMPDIFRGIHLDPLVPANSFYLLWMILGYMVATSVLIVSRGRRSDMFGRVKIYNLGFLIYTIASLVLTVDWMTGRAGAAYLIVFRIVQGIGGACLMANAAAIITDGRVHQVDWNRVRDDQGVDRYRSDRGDIPLDPLHDFVRSAGWSHQPSPCGNLPQLR